VLEGAAKTDATLLITGESGTGKELAAQAVHERSNRRDGPFVVLDCGAASASLIESQLFGHARGAFTGALEARAGVFEAADTGTLVLDEIGELPLDLQPKLLRAVETKVVQRLGETKPRSVDVRFVACTNRNLEEEVRSGRFRQDLLYRLSVITVRLPALRERKEELPRLVRHFLSTMTSVANTTPELSPQVMQLLLSHDWPGNVRELRNFAERFLALPGADPAMLLPRAESDEATDPDRPFLASVTKLPFHEAKRRWTDHFEKAYLMELFELEKGNVSAVARAAGLSRQSCYRLMLKHGIRVE
jgi:DNA-binding NtrC family response regulator